jgi:hypothetical protein
MFALANHPVALVTPEGVAGFSGTEEQLAVDGGFLRLWPTCSALQVVLFMPDPGKYQYFSKRTFLELNLC